MKTKKFSKMSYEEKMLLLFDFYMEVILSPDDYDKSFSMENCIFPSSECCSLDFARVKEEKTTCSEFKFISKRSKIDCPQDQYGKGCLTLIKRLLVVEGFIPKEIRKKAN